MAMYICLKNKMKMVPMMLKFHLYGHLLPYVVFITSFIHSLILLNRNTVIFQESDEHLQSSSTGNRSADEHDEVGFILY